MSVVDDRFQREPPHKRTREFKCQIMRHVQLPRNFSHLLNLKRSPLPKETTFWLLRTFIVYHNGVYIMQIFAAVHHAKNMRHLPTFNLAIKIKLLWRFFFKFWLSTKNWIHLDTLIAKNYTNFSRYRLKNFFSDTDIVKLSEVFYFLFFVS